MRIAESELRYGDLESALTTLRPNTSRFFPQEFRDFHITSSDIDENRLIVGYVLPL